LSERVAEDLDECVTAVTKSDGSEKEYPIRRSKAFSSAESFTRSP
jgi:hypothetical protein